MAEMNIQDAELRRILGEEKFQQAIAELDRLRALDTPDEDIAEALLRLFPPAHWWPLSWVRGHPRPPRPR